MRRLLARSVVLIAFATTPAFADESMPTARSVALKVVGALLVDHNIPAAKAHIAADAERKSGGPGSMIKVLDKWPKDELAQITLERVKFFSAADIDALSKEHPDDMWPRLKQKLDGGLGVLAVQDVAGKDADEARAAGKRPVGLMAMVIKTVDGRPQVVYSDDN